MPTGSLCIGKSLFFERIARIAAHKTIKSNFMLFSWYLRFFLLGICNQLFYSMLSVLIVVIKTTSKNSSQIRPHLRRQAYTDLRIYALSIASVHFGGCAQKLVFRCEKCFCAIAIYVCLPFTEGAPQIYIWSMPTLVSFSSQIEGKKHHTERAPTKRIKLTTSEYRWI